MPEDKLVATSDSPPGDTVLDALIDIWDGKSIQSLTQVVNDEITLRAKSNCTMKIVKRNVSALSSRMSGKRLRDSSDEEGGSERSANKDNGAKDNVAKVAKKQKPAAAVPPGSPATQFFYKYAGIMLAQSVPGTVIMCSEATLTVFI